MKVRILRNWHFITLFNKVGELVGEISWTRFKETFFPQAISEIGVVYTCPRQGTMTLEYAATYPVGTIFTFDTSDGDKVLTLDEEVTIVGLKAKLEAMALDVEWTTSTDGFTNSNYIYYKSNTLEITGVSVTTPNIGYGRLYNWYAATDTRGLAPTGWHIPTDTEFATLSTYLGGDSIAGGALKETGLSHWASPNPGATNSSGFTALPGGLLEGSAFETLHTAAYFWTSVSATVSDAKARGLGVGSVVFGGDDLPKTDGISVRCIYDLLGESNEPSSPIVDGDGNEYTYVGIGSGVTKQWWLVENLKTLKYINGSLIGTDFSGTTGAVCAYNNDETYV